MLEIDSEVRAFVGTYLGLLDVSCLWLRRQQAFEVCVPQISTRLQCFFQRCLRACGQVLYVSKMVGDKYEDSKAVCWPTGLDLTVCPWMSTDRTLQRCAVLDEKQEHKPSRNHEWRQCCGFLI